MIMNILLIVAMVVLSSLFSSILLMIEIYVGKNLSYDHLVAVMWFINWVLFAGLFLLYAHQW